jgi:hypothetical protein
MGSEMNLDEKVIKNKLGLLKLSEQLGQYRKPVKGLGIVEIVFTDLGSCTKKAGKLP